ncbi:glycosyltransferase family 2 protein [Flagellimonas allohymeniacidonis]|uniref:Glycosyltransferase family 2 protein n=1 Tax=Flagellimonas allohymeniacidonis TaxID=2517819 RepID=A0A4Q8QEP9_9FLAO|nr:glycosyltransferase family 2 protein [Allomuricauda hymeniacidonis]TAI48931.1 glycosyltransferase family 2 protein [Allomuricauda hymeniacidonis]
MKIAVVILNWNGKSLLERFLPSVLAHSDGADIYLVDNASTDDSIDFVNQNYPSIGIVQNTSNGGFAKGYNDGLKTIDADVYCLLNSDVEVTPNWLGPVIDTFDALPKTAIIQPKILDLKRKDHFEYAGAAGGFIDKLGYPFCRGRIFQALEKDEGQYDDVSEVFWATGACMFIRSSVFWSLGGFDEDYFAHQEEVDLCWRAKNQGHKVYYVGKSQVYHLGGSTLDNMNPKKTFLNFRNSLYSITKNLPRRKAFSIIFLRLLLDGVAALRFIVQLKFSHCIAILRAHFSFYTTFRKMYRKREKANFLIKYYSTTSIVWSHFVHHVNNFNILVKD